MFNLTAAQKVLIQRAVIIFIVSLLTALGVDLTGVADVPVV